MARHKRASRADIPIRKCLHSNNPLSEECLKIIASISRESQVLDFKGQFDISSNRDWIELTKDIVAMANSGGGYIIFGKDSQGNPTGYNLDELIQMDQAELVDKIARYVDSDIGSIAITSFKEGSYTYVILHIPAVQTPLVIRRPGAYKDTKNPSKQKWVFRPGMLFFRHGSKSEPATQSDIDRFFSSYLKEMRSHLIKGMRKVVETPLSHKLVALPKNVYLTRDDSGTPVYISGQDNAIPVKGLIDDSPYSSEEEEVLGIVKAMKTDSEAYASEAQLWRMYAKRRYLRRITEEGYVTLLVSSLHRYTPPCYWASKLRNSALSNVLSKIIEQDSYPSVHAAVWVIFCWKSSEAKQLLEHVKQNSKYPSVKNAAKKALKGMEKKNHVWHRWAPRKLTIGNKTFSLKNEYSEDQIAKLEVALDKIVNTREKRSEAKLLDRLRYGPIIGERE